MRVHRLAISGLGPFADAQELDFDALSEAGLFLLTGPTGAGKTTILDSIVYALYGSVPGARGRGSRGERGTSSRIVSDLRTLDSQPQVELEFTVQGRRIRVLRVPQHERPRARGEGTTTDKGSVHLWELRNGDWRPLSERVEEVQREITALMGMNADQFAQVVLLPQGEFAGFLRASDQERREILSRLFRVDRYATAERWLEDRARESRQTLESATQEAEAIVQRVAGALGLAEAEAQLATAGVDAAREWLAPHGARIAQELDGARAQRAATEAAAQQAQERQARTQRVAERAAEQARRTTRLDELAARLAAAREWLISQGEEELSGAPGRWEAAATAAAQRRVQLEERSADAERAEAMRQRAQAAAAQQAQLATEQAALEQQLPELRAALTTAQTAVQQAAAAPAELAAAQEAMQQLQAAQAAADHLAARLAEQGQATAAARAAAAQQEQALAALDGATAQADALLLAAREQRLSAREALQAVQTDRLQARASELAAALQDGEPCAVCGATHHPSPASPIDGRDLPAEQDAAEAHVLQIEQHVEQIAAVQAALHQAREELYSDGTPPPLAPAPSSPALGESLDAQLAPLRSAADAARQAHRAHQERLAGAAALAGRVEEARRAAETQPLTPQAREAAEQRLAQATAAAQAAKEAEQRLATATSALAEAEQSLQTRAAELARLTQQIAGDQEQATELSERLRELSAPHATLTEALEHARQRSTGLDHAVDLLREQENLTAELTQATAALAEARALEVPGDGEPAAIEDRLAARTQASERARQASAESFATEQRLTTQQQAVDVAEQQLTALQERLGPLATEAERLQRLDQTVRGQGDNQRRISLTTYVLAARLEEVAAAATEHLLRMSGGRYELHHHDERYGNAQAGLGLRVLDGHSGELRDTATLSGGEAFYASLALALGLADVVQREAGGRPLDTLLVDEGFGSLDAGTLEEVLGELDELRSRGRAIGVVSHVGALSERITTQLQVQPGPTGSTARVRVGAEA